MPEMESLGINVSIPILEAMGIRVLEAKRGWAVAELPPEPNINHFGVTYAGSLFSVAEMLGGILSLVSFELDGMVPVVKNSTIHFRRPARGTIRAEVSLPLEEIARVQTDAQHTGRGEFVLEAVLTDEQGEIVATTIGTYQIRRLSHRGERSWGTVRQRSRTRRSGSFSKSTINGRAGAVRRGEDIYLRIMSGGGHDYVW